MPEREEPQSTGASEEEPRLLNMSQLAAELGTTRQSIHAWRRSHGDFPAPRRRPGSTRDEWDLDEVRRYWEARELRPGHRTDLRPGDEGGEQPT
ncbi:helix-turn-helix transcriptional regulator [Streptomyces sp. NPDC006527]|jgi:predicted DNA-binding transcriptional regulator AlpA|uniref:helix-turn-helix transcriptional regulator n=1 Tax=Streptomyces sp. NPDC006527 TaxID=3364749 RepID=UPI0036D16340